MSAPEREELPEVAGPFMDKLLAQGREKEPHKDLTVEVADQLPLTDQAFGMVADNGILKVPTAFDPMLRETGISSAAELYVYMNDCPEIVAVGIGWDNGRVRRNLESLRTLLADHVDLTLLEAADPQDFGFGALLPNA